jgi:hypothetical protein
LTFALRAAVGWVANVKSIPLARTKEVTLPLFRAGKGFARRKGRLWNDALGSGGDFEREAHDLRERITRTGDDLNRATM